MSIGKTFHLRACLLLVLCAQLATGQATKPAANSIDPIAGRLLDADGKPLANVKMCLCS